MKTREVVINACFGGFSLSDAACLRLRELGNKVALEETMCGEQYKDSGSVCDIKDSNCRDIKRDDPQLVQVIKELGDKANGSCAELKVVKVPCNIEWGIHEYDGLEHVEESHQTWS